MKHKTFLITLVFTILTIDSIAQSNTMYYLTGVPHTYRLNPATQPKCNFFFGIPVINSLYLETYNSSFGLTDLIWNDPETNQVIHPLHPDADLDAFFNKFNKDNTFSVDFAFSPISLGLRIRDMFFAFDITTKIQGGLYYPGDFFPLILRGNQNQTTYDLSSLGLQINSYVEYALSVSRNFSDVLQVGIRPKFITGLGNISSVDNNINLYTDVWEWPFDSKIELKVCTPGLYLPENEDGVFDPSGEFVYDSTLSGFSDYRKLFMKNRGLGIDLGVNFKPVEVLTLSASIIDLGYIKWNDFVHTATLTGSLTYEGIEWNGANDTATTNFLDHLLDTIKSNFEVTGSSEPYKTNLGPKLYLGASLALLPSLDIGILSRIDFLNSGTKANVLIHANWEPSTVFSLAATYSPFGGRASTFGLGFSLRGGPIAFYTVADYRAFRYNLYKYEKYPVFIAPNGRTRFNLQIGFNIMIGANQRKRLMRDKPMYFSDES